MSHYAPLPQNESAHLGPHAGASVRAYGNPADEIRTNLSRLTARARQLAAANTDTRVLHNGRSVYEMSKKAVERSRQQTKWSSTVSADGPPASNASVELFMAKQLGFDAREQERALQTLQNNQMQVAQDVGPLESMGGGDLVTTHGVGVESVVADIRNSIILQTQNEVHRRVTNQMRELEYTLFKSAWSSYYVSMADDFESAGCEHQDAGGATVLTQAHQRVPAGLVQLLSSDSPVAAELNLKAAAFAPIVENNVPGEWMPRFAAFVSEQAVRTGDRLAVLWATAEQIVESVARKGAAGSVMSYVAASRSVLERKSLSHILTQTLKIDPSRFDEIANMSASRVLDIVSRSSGTTNPWAHVFISMRAGRYDVALLAAERIGATPLDAALRKYAEAVPEQRNTIPACMELMLLYMEPSTRDDAYRHAVLFLLLVGRTEESEEVTLRIMMDLCSKVAHSLEDALWLRLACIRTAEKSVKCGPLQCLADMQKMIMEDLQDVVKLTAGDIPRLASFLLHALLPSTALRLLLEKDVTYVDGFHLALCFNTCDLLQCSPAEAPIDLSRHIPRYCSLVLLDLDKRRRDGVYAGASTYSYFHKTGFDEAFAEFCQTDAVCARLFGQRGMMGGTDGLLLSRSQSLTSDVMRAMESVAELAATRSNAPMSVHMFLALAHAAEEMKNEGARKTALRRAVQVFQPAIAQAFYLPSSSIHVTALLVQVGQLRNVLRAEVNTPNLIPSPELAAFEALATMTDVYVSHARGELEQTLSFFLQLPFVPRSLTDVEQCVDAARSASTFVATGAGAIVPLAIRVAASVLQLYRSEASQRWDAGTSLGAHTNSNTVLALRQQMQAVCEWVKRCSQSGIIFHQCPQEVSSFEQHHLP